MTQYQEYLAITRAEASSMNQGEVLRSIPSSSAQTALPFSAHDVSPAFDNPQLYQDDIPLSLPALNCLPSYPLSNLRDGEWCPQYNSSFSLSQIPSLAASSPRISRMDTTGSISRPQTPAGYPVPAFGFISPQAYDSQSYTPSIYTSPSFTVTPAPIFPHTWKPCEGEFNDPPVPLHSPPSLHFISQSTSPQTIYSDIPEERPPWRRRTTLSAESISSDSGDVSESPLTRPSVISRRSSRDSCVLKARAHRKARMQPQLPPTTDASSSFSTFMLNASLETYEPTGGVYMSTVDFKSDADAARQVFEHGPTDLPPRAYIGGPDADSPWKPRKNLGSIPGSALDYLPVVEDRMARLEGAIDAYLQYRGEEAVRNSILPGMDTDSDLDCVMRS